MSVQSRLAEHLTAERLVNRQYPNWDGVVAVCNSLSEGQNAACFILRKEKKKDAIHGVLCCASCKPKRGKSGAADEAATSAAAGAADAVDAVDAVDAALDVAGAVAVADALGTGSAADAAVAEKSTEPCPFRVIASFKPGGVHWTITSTCRNAGPSVPVRG